MSDTVDKQFLISTLTNDALHKLTVPNALQIINDSVTAQISKEIENLNEAELSSLNDSVQKAMEEAEAEKEKEGEAQE